MALERNRQCLFADGRPSANKVGLSAPQAATLPGLSLAVAIGK